MESLTKKTTLWVVSCELWNNYWLFRSPENSGVKSLGFYTNISHILLNIKIFARVQWYYFTRDIYTCIYYFATCLFEQNSHLAYMKSIKFTTNLIKWDYNPNCYCQLFHHEEITWVYFMFIKYWYVKYARYVVLPSNVPNLLKIYNQNGKTIKVGVKR